jgi:hypothetical protein
MCIYVLTSDVSATGSILHHRPSEVFIQIWPVLILRDYGDHLAGMSILTEADSAARLKISEDI